MNPVARARLAVLCLFAFAASPSLLLRAATYLPLSDEELALRAPVIVQARVVGQETRIGTERGQEIVLTRTRFLPLEVYKGSIASPTFSIELPGGESGGLSYRIPGTPVFAAGDEVVLFLSPGGSSLEDGFLLTEFGLSRFDIVADRNGRRFAIRPAFEAGEDDTLSRRERVFPAAPGERHPHRDADSFAASLRGVGSGDAFLPVTYASPEGEERSPRLVSPEWVNIGGTEGGSRLYRWFWDTGRSPAARVVASGTQSGLSDGSDGLASVQNAAMQWSAVPGAAVLYSPTSGSTEVVVNLDVASHGSYWSEPMSCGSGGVIGLGGPGPSYNAGSYKGDGNYSAVTSGNVWMRKVTGGCYSWRTFRTAVLHEVGHTLGLGHSDQANSIHSTTQMIDRSSAVMASAVPYTTPSAPQADDIQAILWLYGAVADAPPVPDRPRPVLSTRRPRPGNLTLELRP